jgi:hypothetical protein
MGPTGRCGRSCAGRPSCHAPTLPRPDLEAYASPGETSATNPGISSHNVPRAKLLPRIRASPPDRSPGPTRRLTPSAGATHTPPTSRRRAVNGTSTRRASAERPGGWWKPGWRRRRMDPGASGPNGKRPAANAANRPPSRLRRRAPAIQGSADRQGPGRRPGHGRRSRSAATPNEGGTAEGTTFRPGTNGRS